MTTCFIDNDTKVGGKLCNSHDIPLRASSGGPGDCWGLLLSTVTGPDPCCLWPNQENLHPLLETCSRVTKSKHGQEKVHLCVQMHTCVCVLCLYMCAFCGCMHIYEYVFVMNICICVCVCQDGGGVDMWHLSIPRFPRYPRY
jgi:hypothetical protein